MNEIVNKKGENCQNCYRLKECMLTTAQSKLCGGPFKNEDDRSEFIREHILGIKKK
jgi:hypothetical protein